MRQMRHILLRLGQMNNISFKRYLTEEITKEVRATTLLVLKGVVLATPVDTGRARGNWQLSSDRPITFTTEEVDRTGSKVINKGLNFLFGPNIVSFTSFWISNNLEYIEDLNNGTSKQAPAKFVETVIKKVTNGR